MERILQLFRGQFRQPTSWGLRFVSVAQTAVRCTTNVMRIDGFGHTHPSLGFPLLSTLKSPSRDICTTTCSTFTQSFSLNSHSLVPHVGLASGLYDHTPLFSSITYKQRITITMTGDDNKGPMFVVVFGSLVAIAILLVVLRIWVRIKIIRKLGLDDWIMMASLV